MPNSIVSISIGRLVCAQVQLDGDRRLATAHDADGAARGAAVFLRDAPLAVRPRAALASQVRARALAPRLRVRCSRRRLRCVRRQSLLSRVT